MSAAMTARDGEMEKKEEARDHRTCATPQRRGINLSLPDDVLEKLAQYTIFVSVQNDFELSPLFPRRLLNNHSSSSE